MFIFLFIYFLTLVTVKTSLANIDLLSLPPGTVTSFYGLGAGNQLGKSVRNAGDVNGDGIQDIIIGSPATTGTGTGVAYVIYGNKNGIPDRTLGSLSPTQGFMIIGPAGLSTFGDAVGKAGDLNADGIGDIIIGAYLAPSSGAVFVIFGQTAPRSTFIVDPTTLQPTGKGFTITGPVANAQFGSSLSFAGDVNFDGLDDVIIGAYMANGAFVEAGKAYVIFGRNAATTPITDIDLSSPLTLGFTIAGDTLSQHLGASVSSAGDFNGDGFDDIIVGAIYSSAPGAVYIIFGHSGITDITVPSGLTSAAGFKIEGIMNGDFLGFSASGAGDFNGDGFADVIVGGPFIGSGAAFVIFGKSSPGVGINLATTTLASNNLGFKIYTTNTENSLGFVVTNAGDLDADGIEDIAVEALVSGSGPAPIATAYVIFGKKSGFSDVDLASLSSSQGFAIENIQVGLALITALSKIGDVNGDGGDDFIIGCPNDNTSPAISGSAHIFYGIPKSVHPNNPLQGIIDTENFGTAVGRIVAMASSLFQSTSIIPFWFIFLEQILQYPKYLLIEYPPRLQNIYDDSQFQLFTIPGISQIPDELNKKITEYSLPGKFEEYGFDSSFLVNFWNSLMTFLIIILVIVVAIVADRCTVSNQSLRPFFNKAKYRLKWNYIISMFTGSFCDIALFTSFELRTLHFESAAEWVSFFLCILVNLVVLALSIRIAFIIKKFAKRQALPSQNRRRKRLSQITQDELKSYQVVFEGFKKQTLKQQSYFLLYSLRFYLFYIIIGYLFEHTLVQSILVNLIGIATLLFLGFVRPLEDKMDFIVSLTQEGALQVIHSCVFLFALDDQVNFGSQGFRVVLGDLILGCNAIFMGITIMYSFILALILLKEIYLWISMKCHKQNKMNSDNQNVISSEKMRSRATATNENRSELDKVNESQIYLNRELTEQEISTLKININQCKHNSNILNSSTLEESAPQIASSNPISDWQRLKLLNPREEEWKKIEREKRAAAAESNNKQERINRIKRKKVN